MPGETPVDQSDAALEQSARRIGLPVLCKPSAGGPRIGMKTVREAAELRDAIQRARREALAAFGDDTLYVERLIERPLDGVIQILVDRQGNAIHLFERECSIQRRHQKTIEETPCLVLSSSMRQQMGAAAVAAARAVGYVNAGTVEFLLEGRGDAARFYFLEMNARLQVEHPITEAVVGVDLVQAQLRIASGEPLRWTQDELTQRGHALECRIYAEHPARDFLPQAGRLLMYREPQGPGIRIDSGVVEGDEVTVFYDPNVEFLNAILRHPRFVSNDVDTSFLDQERDALHRALEMEKPPQAAIAAAAVHSDSGGTGAASRPATEAAVDPFDALRGWRPS